MRKLCCELTDGSWKLPLEKIIHRKRVAVAANGAICLTDERSSARGLGRGVGASESIAALVFGFGFFGEALFAIDGRQHAVEIGGLRTEFYRLF